MLFRKSPNPEVPVDERTTAGSSRKAGSGAHTPVRVTPRIGAGQAADAAMAQLLDAIGGMLGAFIRYPLDMPSLPADQTGERFATWQRHAVLGFPVNPDAADQRSVGVAERDWDGLVRTVVEQRKQEQQFVRDSVGELQDALWACVEAVHNAVKLDQSTDTTTDAQMVRARHALQRLTPGEIKQEVLGAVSAIEQALHTRREQQREQYVSLASKLDKLGKQLEEAKRESTTDPLTELGNRKLFDVVMPRAIQMASLTRQPIVLLLCDMDKLKLVNDMHGHRAGDIALQNLARTLKKTFLRQSDVVCRIGGDEFAVIMHNTDWKIAQTLARRLQEQLAAMPAPHPAMEFALGVSVGVAQLSPADDIESWVARADKALYKAKQHGRDRVCVAELLPETS